MNNLRKGLLEILTDLDNGNVSNLREVQGFCIRYDVVLMGVSWTNERGFREPMYFFSDDLGGYTIDALQGSI